MINKLIELSNELQKDLSIKDDFYSRDISSYKEGNYVLIGMRRLGKTEYLKYRAKESKLKNEEILYLNLDSPSLNAIDFTRKGEKYEKFIESIYEILKLGGVKLVLLDEVQRIKEWSRLLKGFVDQFSNVTFVATGSDALDLSASSETGVGRFEIIYVGPILYREAIKMKPNLSFIDYVNDYSFPQGPELSKETRYQAVIEKQILSGNFSKLNVEATIRAIALNPGVKLTRNSLVKKVVEISDSSMDSKQIEPIIDFLVKSNLAISLTDITSAQRIKKADIYTLYPYDWNTYMYYEVGKTYKDLESKVNGDEIKNLPAQGFVFENMIISNVYSSLRTSLDKNRLFNKIEQPDIDFILDKINYEIKSFDVLKASIEVKSKIIKKAKETSSQIIHTGATSEVDGITFINAQEFLINL